MQCFLCRNICFCSTRNFCGGIIAVGKYRPVCYIRSRSIIISNLCFKFSDILSITCHNYRHLCSMTIVCHSTRRCLRNCFIDIKCIGSLFCKCHITKLECFCSSVFCSRYDGFIAICCYLNFLILYSCFGSVICRCQCEFKCFICLHISSNKCFTSLKSCISSQCHWLIRKSYCQTAIIAKICGNMCTFVILVPYRIDGL